MLERLLKVDPRVTESKPLLLHRSASPCLTRGHLDESTTDQVLEGLTVLSQDLVIPVLCIYPKNVPPYHKYVCPTMFRPVLFIIARNWKQNGSFKNAIGYSRFLG